MVQRSTVVQLLAVLALISLTSCARKGKTQTQNEATDFKDVLIVTLTDLLAQQTQKLNEANLENEQLKMNLSNCTTTGLIKDLRTEFSQQIEALKDKLAGSENNTTTKLDELREEAARAENSTTEKIEDMKYNVSVVTTKLGELKHEVTRAQNSTTEKIEDITTNLTMVTSGVEDLVSKVSAVEDVAGTWPKGAYCILGSGGSCPTGFTRHEGYVKKIYTYTTNISYLKQARFGDSYVGCWGGYSTSCSGNGNFRASIAITACCK